MNTRLIIASVIGCILFFFLGWLIYGVLLMHFYVAHTTQDYQGLMRETPNYIAAVISDLSVSFLLAFIFQRWAGIKTFTKGILAGLLITFLIALWMDLYFVAFTKLYDAPFIIVDIIVYTALGGLIGGVIGWILGYEKKKVAA
jgi:hypothetical protein